jgi:hypothetical protein
LNRAKNFGVSISRGELGGGWARVIYFFQNEDAIASLWFGFGADPQLPLRPWPQVFSEVRNGRKDLLTGVVVCGVFLATQTRIKVLS